jgi:arsenate reductase
MRCHNGSLYDVKRSAIRKEAAKPPNNSNTEKKAAMIKPRVLFLCTANSCRSQMAEAFLRHLAADQFEVASAGARPTQLNPDAVRVMREIGVDMSSHRSKDSKEFFGQRYQYVITVCNKTKERCPIFPGAIWKFDWIVDDPVAVTGMEAQRLAVFRRVRDEIEEHVHDFISKHS